MIGARGVNQIVKNVRFGGEVESALQIANIESTTKRKKSISKSNFFRSIRLRSIIEFLQ